MGGRPTISKGRRNGHFVALIHPRRKKPPTLSFWNLIEAHVAFGRPIVVRSGTSTRVIAERIDAGESVNALAEDYDLTASEIEEAVLYERAA